jgi:hypothetical protein
VCVFIYHAAEVNIRFRDLPLFSESSRFSYISERTDMWRSIRLKALDWLVACMN